MSPLPPSPGSRAGSRPTAAPKTYEEWQRAATCWTQAVLVLRWFKDDTAVHLLGRDAGVSQATAYRYLHEAVDVIADRAPELTDVLDEGLANGWAYVCLDGTLIETSRCGARSENGYDLWYSGKHRDHGGNIQVVTDPTGFPVWTSPVEPGSRHGIAAARAHALPALYTAASAGMPTLADKGYVGAGAGILVPIKGNKRAPDNKCRNQLLNALRAPAERANSLLMSMWKALRQVTVCPKRIGPTTAAELVLLTMQRGHRSESLIWAIKLTGPN